MEFLPAMKRVRTDEQLIEQFLTENRDDSEQAFEVLVRRHGPMVMGVCRQALNRHEDAEDVFQATFLTLARQAGTIRNGMVLGTWLYEVAYRLALRNRTRVSRSRVLLAVADCQASADGPEIAASRKELGQVLHAELNRLPEKYRILVVQCYLEGKTNQEVARLLDCPIGTVKGRLFQAREMLRERLSRTTLDLDDAGDRTGLAVRSDATASTRNGDDAKRGRRETGTDPKRGRS
jgi:RNA polymerase sigma factor (sigma-70 family)